MDHVLVHIMLVLLNESMQRNHIVTDSVKWNSDF